MSDPPPLIPLPFVFDISHHRITRELSRTISKFLNNLIHNSTVPLSFETFPEDIYTIPLICEHHDSYLYYIDTQSVVETPDEPPFSIPSTSPINPSVTVRKNIHLLISIYIPIAHIFTSFLNNHLEKNIILPKHVLTHPQSKSSFKRNIFLTSLILNNFALLKITLITGLPLISSKFTTFDTNYSKPYL